MKKITIIALFFLILFVLLIIASSQGQILRIQGWFSVSIITISFWVFVILMCLRVILSDAGFMKIGAILGIVLAFFMLLLVMVNKPVTYQRIASEGVELIIEVDDSLDNRVVRVYSKGNMIFSDEVKSVYISKHYTLTYEITEGNLLIRKCTEYSCIDELIVID